MAAIHLLPRELLTFIGALHPSRHSHRQLDGLLSSSVSLHWARFRSDYRPSHAKDIDQALAREFDKPQEGFSFPVSPPQEQLNSFMEEDAAEYTQRTKIEAKLASDVESTATLRRTVPKANISTPSVGIQPLPYVKIQHCLNRGDTESALAWFEQAPALAGLAGRQQRLGQLRTMRALQAAVLTDHAKDVDVLLDFGLLSAQKGFTASLGHALLAHIARFSGYERLQPFWSSYTAIARQAAFSLSVLEKQRLEAVLDSTANIIIRAQCLAARYMDALSLLRDGRTRQLRVSRSPASSVYRSPIEAFTYKLFLEEVSRHKAHPAIFQELSSLARQDWPAPVLSNPRLQPTSTALRAETSLSSIQLKRQTGIDNPKAAYIKLRRMIFEGIRPTALDMGNFARLCREQGTSHLLSALERQLTMPEAELEHDRLKFIMQEGLLPSSEELRLFIESCRYARCLGLAKALGDWMESQGARFKSLWVTARMLRLVKLGGPTDARRALDLFAKSFVMVGVPDQIREHARAQQEWILLQMEGMSGLDYSGPPIFTDQPTTTAMPSVEPHRLWPSSHGISIAIKALFLLHPASSDYVQSVYSSFSSASYFATTLPLSMLPDAVSYDTFLLPLVRLGTPEVALGILHDMLDRGLVPNQHNWDVVIGGFAKQGDLKMVNEIFLRRELQRQVRFADRVKSPKAALQIGNHSAFDGHFGNFFTQEHLPLRSTLVEDATNMSSNALHRNGNPVTGLARFPFPAPTIVTYATVIRGLLLAGKLADAKVYRSRMYDGKDENGGRIYRFGESPKADKALQILDSMEKLDRVGKSKYEKRNPQ
ncbi:MAG: hypothetical protein CYPHOPRED_000715 [Cyphobasidiales sp. Tagirdzhanova-0007]|nr:MAG: hypothetical protein CYPHOPRED_000715 [Cyphobasidiales sp. Tagirdzhanova-0007]